MLNEEWMNFLQNQDSFDQPTVSRTTTDGDELLPPTCTELYISTTTKIIYTHQQLDISSLFWLMDLIPYSDPREGVLKKQMKFNSNSKEELEDIQTHLAQIQNSPITQELISFHDDTGRLKFRDVRKISVGFCSKDLIYKAKKKSAFYNCFVVILRVKVGSIFKEYHVKIFNTGKMEIPGIQNDAEFDKVTRCILYNLGRFVDDLAIKTEETDTVLINSNFNCGFYIKRDVLYEILQQKYKIQCVFDSCSYPGIQCKFFYNSEKDVQNGLQDYDDIKGKGYGYNKSGEKKIKNKLLEKKESKYTEVSIMIFRTGSVLIVGMCTEPILQIVYEFLQSVLSTEYCSIRQNGATPKQQPKKQRRKKIKKLITNEQLSENC